MAAALKRRELFGGAILISVPESWLDTEQFMDIIKRPVPDNQELFVAPSGPSETDADARPVALFIDVLEAATDKCPDMTSAPYFHAREVLRRDERDAEADSLMAVQAAPLPRLHESMQAGTAEGTSATWSSFASADLDVCVIRIPLCTTDIVLSLHGRQRPGDNPAHCPELSAVASTLCVLDWSLFGEQGDNDGGNRYLGS